MRIDAGTMPPATYRELLERHREEGSDHTDPLSLRIHRSLSWYGRALEEKDDPDARFLFYWIAFNAAYAQEYSDRLTLGERRLLLDSTQVLYSTVWEHFPGPFHTLLDNRYVYQPFWDAIRSGSDPPAWRDQFEHSRRRALRTLAQRDTERVLVVIFRSSLRPAKPAGPWWSHLEQQCQP